MRPNTRATKVSATLKVEGELNQLSDQPNTYHIPIIFLYKTFCDILITINFYHNFFDTFISHNFIDKFIMT